MKAFWIGIAVVVVVGLSVLAAQASQIVGGQVGGSIGGSPAGYIL